MGGCATKSGDLKANGKAPLAADDTAVPSTTEKNEPLPVAAEASPADVSCRRSLSGLFNMNPEGPDKTRETDKVVAEESVSIVAAAAAETKQEAEVQPVIVIEERSAEASEPVAVQELVDAVEAVTGDSAKEVAASTEEKEEC